MRKDKLYEGTLFPNNLGEGYGFSEVDLAPYIEHTLLRSNATTDEIIKLCSEVKYHHFCGVCVNPIYVELAKRELSETKYIVVSVVGFPLGADLTITKVRQAKSLVRLGVDELDMVLNIGALKSGKYEAVFQDIRAVATAAGKVPIKVIIETGSLNWTEKVNACLIAHRAKAAFVKTSTGFVNGGATVEDVRTMKATVGHSLGIKASGGIKTYKIAKTMLRAGATRLGCSASVAIVTNGKQNKE